VTEPRWFRIETGEHAGRLHLAGWFLSSVKGEDWAPRGRIVSDGWLGFGICPVCSAMVPTGGNPRSPGGWEDRTWQHERWHARTDFPVPPELLTEQDRQAGYGRD
jgi:hypothetical protein